MHKGWLTGGAASAMAESIWKPHTTVAAICERDGKYLLVREDVDGRVVYNQPAGHLDPDETLTEAVIRETLEETRYSFRPTALVGVYRYPLPRKTRTTFLRFAFRGEAGERLAGDLDHAIIAAEWLTYEDILACREQHRTPMVLQCIDDARRNPGYPLSVLSERFA